MFTQWFLTVHPHQDFLLSFKCICSPSYFRYLLRKGRMKGNCLSCPGRGPASRALTPKGAPTCAVLQKEATPRQGAGRQRLAATRAYVCLFSKHGEEIFRSRTPAVQTVPVQPPRTWSAGRPRVVLSSRGFPPPLCCRRESCATRAQQPRPAPPSLPPRTGKGRSSISSRSLNTEWEGRHGQTGRSQGGQRQNEELLFLSTPEMMFYWSSQT